MRSCGPAKQCLWMGPGRYSCRGGRRNAYPHTDSDTHCYSDRDPNAYRKPHANGNAYAATDANTQGGAIRKAATHTSAAALDFSIAG